MLSLSAQIDRVVLEKLKGGQLLDLLFAKSLNGNSILQKLYEDLRIKCYEFLFQQLSTWILYGQIYDPYDEMFVYKIKNQRDESKILEGQ